MKYQPPFDPSFAGPVNGIYNADPDASYVNGNPSTGAEGSIPPFESVEHTMRELVHLIEDAGLTPDHEDLEQVRKAIKAMIEEAVVSNPVTGGAVEIWEGLQPVTGFHKIRPLVAGSNVTIDLVEEPSDSGQYQVRISSTAAGGGGSASLVNIGTGANVYKGLNGGNEELRRIRGVDGITVTQNTNDISISGSGLGLAPFFPEVETDGGVLAVSATTGQVTVQSGKTFIHRGTRRISTSDTALGGRQFATSANKTYHLRWRWNAGAPAYVLLDLANAGYNPGGAAETSTGFDSEYDDMLIARVVTNGSNVPTVTALKNLHSLRDVIFNLGDVPGAPGNALSRTATETYNWARRPDLLPSMTYINSGSSGANPNAFQGGDTHDHDEIITVSSVTRYAWTLDLMRDYALQVGVRVLMIA